MLEGGLAVLGYSGRAITVGNVSRAEARAVDVSGLSQGNRSLTGVFLGAELEHGDRSDRLSWIRGLFLRFGGASWPFLEPAVSPE